MEWALKYAADGFAVFPVYEPSGINKCSCGKYGCRGKHPRTINGVIDASVNYDQIKEWWTKWPSASIGIATGSKSKLAVVDLDGQEGIVSGRRLGLSSNVCALTGSGKQLFYADTEARMKNSVKKLAAGVDTRGEGGYIVASPSLHPNGKRYTWLQTPLCRNQLSPLPPFLLKENTSGSQISTIRKPEGWMSEALEAMKHGHVANTLVSVLGKFKAHGFTEADTINLIRPFALVEGKPFEGLDAKVYEIWRRYPQTSFGIEKSETIGTFLEDIKEVSWICKPFVAKKSIGFVVGLPATLKTWLCIDLAVECARETGLWLGLFPVTGCKVLFVDQERWRGETQRRFAAVLAAKQLERGGLKDKLYLKSGTTIRLNIDSSYQAFRTELLEMRPDLVIVDSFATFHTVPENDRSEIQKVLERVKQLRNEIGCTILFINHENKMAYGNGEPQGDPTSGTMVGSIGISAAAEFILTVRKVEDNTSMVWQTKSTLAASIKPFYVNVSDVANGIEIRALAD